MERHGPETFATTMEQRRIADRSDPTGPADDAPAVELDWVAEDPATATALDVAAAGDLTPDEAVDRVAAPLGFEPSDDDTDDDYRH